MRERYATALNHTPRVLFGLLQSWQPLVHVIRHALIVKAVLHLDLAMAQSGYGIHQLVRFKAG